MYPADGFVATEGCVELSCIDWLTSGGGGGGAIMGSRGRSLRDCASKLQLIFG